MSNESMSTSPIAVPIPNSFVFWRFSFGSDQKRIQGMTPYLAVEVNEWLIDNHISYSLTPSSGDQDRIEQEIRNGKFVSYEVSIVLNKLPEATLFRLRWL